MCSVVAVLGALLLAGCSGNDADPQSSDPSSSTTDTATASDGAAATSSGRIGEPAIADLTKVRCAPDRHDRWSGSGVLVNATEEKRTYLVYFSLIKTATGQVLDTFDRKIPVKAGAQEKVVVKSLGKGSPMKTTCVQRVTAQ